MKQTMNSFGFIGSMLILIGAFFKMMHWPGANIELGLGTIFIGLIYFPMYFISKLKGDQSSSNRLFFVVGLFTAVLTCVAIYWKVMHWEGGNILRFSALLSMVFLFLPMLYNYLKSKYEDVATMIMPIVVCVSLFVMINMLSNTKSFIDKYAQLEEFYDTHAKNVDHKTPK